MLRCAATSIPAIAFCLFALITHVDTVWATETPPPSVLLTWNLTPDEAARSVAGRILGVSTVVENGRTIYIYKVLTPDGRVMHVKVDSVTGQRL